MSKFARRKIEDRKGVRSSVRDYPTEFHCGGSFGYDNIVTGDGSLE